MSSTPSNDPAGSVAAGSAEFVSRRNKNKYTRWIQFFSWLITLLFILALGWAIYQAFITGETLPLWVWLGVIAILVAIIGLVVAAFVYRSVQKNSGTLGYSPITQTGGEIVSETQRVDAGEAVALRTSIEMAEGTLQVMPGGDAALEANFTYDDADWSPPVVEYQVGADGEGQLSIVQPHPRRHAMRQGRCDWSLLLGKDYPTDLKVKQGAGKSELHLGGMALAHVEVENGVGAMLLDLSGDWQRSLEIIVKTGVGDTKLRLPEEVGVRLLIQVGLGSSKSNNLIWDGEAYVNPAYGNSPVTLSIIVDSGIGKVSLE